MLLVDGDDLESPGDLDCLYVGAWRPRALLEVFLDERLRQAYERRLAAGPP